MKVKVSKVFAKAVNEIAAKYGKRFHAEVRTRRVRVCEYVDWIDMDANTGGVRELVVSYPSEYYACEQCFKTSDLLREFRRQGVKTWEQFERMIVDMFEI